MRRSYIRQAARQAGATSATDQDVEYLMEETRTDQEFVVTALRENGVKVG